MIAPMPALPTALTLAAATRAGRRPRAGGPRRHALAAALP